MIQLVGSKRSSRLCLLVLRITSLPQHTQLYQFTQHKQLPHSRISHSKHGHSTATSCHGFVFVCCCANSFCPFCLLFCYFVCLTPYLFLPLSPFSTNSSHHFSHFFWLTHHSKFLSTSHLPVTKYPFPDFLHPKPLCLFYPFLWISIFYFFSLPPPPLPPAFGRELQSQLFILELLQAHHDGILVYAGLSSAGHQSHTHQLLLHTPHQLCGAHGPRGGQGRRLRCCGCQRGLDDIKGSVVHHSISSGWQSCSEALKKGKEEIEEGHNIWKTD